MSAPAHALKVKVEVQVRQSLYRTEGALRVTGG